VLGELAIIMEMESKRRAEQRLIQAAGVSFWVWMRREPKREAYYRHAVTDQLGETMPLFPPESVPISGI
jgi:hypothetical protein